MSQDYKKNIELLLLGTKYANLPKYSYYDTV